MIVKLGKTLLFLTLFLLSSEFQALAGNKKKADAVKAIHRTSKKDMLKGHAKKASFLFKKTNTTEGAVVRTRLLPIAKVKIRANSNGSVSEGGTYAPCARQIHKLATDVRGGVNKNR